MKKYLVFALAALFIGTLAIGAMAVAPDAGNQASDPAPQGNSNVAFLYLYSKDASWDIVPGAWGKMKYNRSGSSFLY